MSKPRSRRTQGAETKNVPSEGSMTPFPPESKVPNVPSAFTILVDSCEVITIYDKAISD